MIGRINQKAVYQYVAPSATAQVLGLVGAEGDTILRLVCVVSTAATAQVSLKDASGGTDRVVFPAAPGSGVGTYPITLNLTSMAGGWYLTTGAGVAVYAVGLFTN